MGDPSHPPGGQFSTVLRKSVFTGTSETLRLSGIDEDISDSGRYDAVRSRGTAMDRATQRNEIWRLISTPDGIVGSVAAVTDAPRSHRILTPPGVIQTG